MAGPSALRAAEQRSAALTCADAGKLQRLEPDAAAGTGGDASEWRIKAEGSGASIGSSQLPRKRKGKSKVATAARDRGKARERDAQKRVLQLRRLHARTTLRYLQLGDEAVERRAAAAQIGRRRTRLALEPPQRLLDIEAVE